MRKGTKHICGGDKCGTLAPILKRLSENGTDNSRNLSGETFVGENSRYQAKISTLCPRRIFPR